MQKPESAAKISNGSQDRGARLNRRDCMTLALAATAAGCAPFDSVYESLSSKKSAPDTLNGLAEAKGLRFGSALGNGLSRAPRNEFLGPDERADQFTDGRLRALFAEQCGILVPEDALKWYALRPKPTGYDFTAADQEIAFAEQNGIAVRCHTLLWNRNKWMLPWVINYDFGSNPATTAERMLVDHINTVCGRYSKRIFSYDVINESISPATGDLEDSPFSKYLGWNVFDICFHAAREAAPHAELVYNDYTSWGEGQATHYKGVLKLLDYARKNNLPIDTLGVQGHIAVANDPRVGSVVPADGGWRAFLDEVAARKFDLAITEFDVNDKAVPGDYAMRDRAVADVSKAWFDLMLSYPELRYVMAWGLVDKYSWLQNATPRPDGLPKRCCPCDDDYKPVLLWDAIAAAFRAAPTRPAMNYG
jgi:endo-1,4-beta-xylanase